MSFGLEFWWQEVVEEALGADVAQALPELLRLTDLEVRIPRMEVVALERLAALDGETVSTVLAGELRDLVSVHSEWLSEEVSGFAEALAWPECPLRKGKDDAPLHRSSGLTVSIRSTIAAAGVGKSARATLLT